MSLPGSYSDLSVVIVDDYSAMNKTIANMVSTLGFNQVHRAANGKEALEIIEDISPNLIISDWNMPIMNGIELLETVREMSGDIAKVPFIMVTGNVAQDEVIRAVKAGVTEYLIKPFNHNNLKQKVAHAFRVSKQESPEEPISANTSETESTPKTPDKSSILVVDDKANNVTILSELLKNDYRVQASVSGVKAIEICRRDPQPDLVLLDIMMPEIDGLEVCQRLKDDPTTEHIPIIFISALSETHNVVKGLELGAVDYITKPISPEITLARIATHINLVNQRKALSDQLEALIENLRYKEEIEKIIHHDLRGPINAITLANESIQQKHGKRFEEHDIIKDATSAMQKMIDTQMLVSQLENGSHLSESTQINVFKAINEVLFGLKKKCQEVSVLVSSHIDNQIAFQGDPMLSRNLFHNLIANAIEASPKRSKVTISCFENQGKVNIEIHNEGEIPKRIQSRFFDKFATSGKSGGTGIGTYSAKLAAKAQSGDVSFTSNKVDGTRLKIQLNAVEQ